MYIQCNIQALQHNHCCSGKAESNKYCVCVRACARAHSFIFSALYNTSVCDLSGCNIFCHIISRTASFSEKELTEHNMCVLIFSPTFSETFLILSKFSQMLPQMYTSLHVVLIRNIAKQDTWPKEKSELMNKHLKYFTQFANSIDFDKL